MVVREGPANTACTRPRLPALENNGTLHSERVL